MRWQRSVTLGAAPLLLAWGAASELFGQASLPVILPEQRTIQVRDPATLHRAPIPAVPAPPTVATQQADAPTAPLPLDEAIRIALANAQVVRILTGLTATSSGRTIYDPAITNTTVDREQGRFDPRVDGASEFNRNETPTGIFDNLDPTRSQLTGVRTDNYRMNTGVAKTNRFGGEVGLDLNANSDRFRPGIFPLNPQNRSSAELFLTQPLLQGAGVAVNQVPIVIARIDTERSFFQFKDSLQDLVRGVIQGYWEVVFSRTEVWVREQQAAQAKEAYERAEAQSRFGLADAADVSQTRVAYANFRANLLNARATLLQREAALRNILGLPPGDIPRFIPVTSPVRDRWQPNWQALLELAEQNRPDIIELKLILEADEQLLLQRRNTASPRLDAVARYRWNGLEGEMPNGQDVSTRAGEYTDWTMGVNFSVPLGLRRERAGVREIELLVSRDRANLAQGMHATVHDLGLQVRNLDQFHSQYEIYQEARDAAYLNLQQQWAEYRNRRTFFLNVLLAISDWGNAVIAESQSIVQYNIELANLERQTGTILETHGIRFNEERYASLGPLGRLRDALYARSLFPTPNPDQYPPSNRPSESSFDLVDPLSVPGGGATLPEEVPAPQSDVPLFRLPNVEGVRREP